MLRIFISPSKLILAISLPLAFLALPQCAHALTFKILHSFSGGTDGCNPWSGSLVLDSSGNLYGTTAGDLCNSFGTVFKLAPDGTKTLLYAFTGGSDGEGPGGLLMDKKGNLWGTTIGGGIGGGVIFKITSGGREKLVHTFMGSPNDGCGAGDAMVAGTNGKFYGTTVQCGKHDFGTVFKLAPDGAESLLYSFRGGHDGLDPVAGLIVDAQGNLYGTTDYGGRKVSAGTVFELSPSGTKTQLYGFKGPPKDGYLAISNVIMDSQGDFYGTTEGGGRAGCAADYGCGVVFELAPDNTETILHFFTGTLGDGSNPVAGLIADYADNLYGTTEYGGSSAPCNGANGCGTVFEIAPDLTETILHKFKESTDGANPMSGLAADAAGNLYGTAYVGGQYGYGTVFKITP